MQPGAEYLVILNDGQLREAYIQRQHREPRSIRRRKIGDSETAAAHIAHLLIAMRHGLMRFRRLSSSALRIPSREVTPPGAQPLV
jgi:hypothetical protein